MRWERGEVRGRKNRGAKICKCGDLKNEKIHSYGGREGGRDGARERGRDEEREEGGGRES